MLNKLSSNFIISQMQETDLDVVTKIENSIASTPWERQQFLGCSKVYDAFVAVTDNNLIQQKNIQGCFNNNIIGYGIIAIYKHINQAHILNVGVDSNWQRMGVATRILKYLIGLFINNSEDNNHNQLSKTAKEIFLEVNKTNQAAINLYKKFKFIEVGCRKNYYQTSQGKQDALIMRLS